MAQPSDSTLYYIRNVESDRYLRATLDGEVMTGPKVADSLHLWQFYPQGSNKYQLRNMASWRMLTLGTSGDSESTSHRIFAEKEGSKKELWTVGAADDCGTRAITITRPESSLFLYGFYTTWPYAVTKDFHEGKEWGRTHWVLEHAGPA